MEIEEKYQLSVEAGEKAYNDSEGNLEYPLAAALKYFDARTTDHSIEARKALIAEAVERMEALVYSADVRLGFVKKEDVIAILKGLAE